MLSLLKRLNKKKEGKIMKIDFSQVLCGLDGKPMTENDGSAATLKSVTVMSLLAVYQDERPTGEEKFRRYDVAARVQASKDPVDVTEAEIKTIKDLVGKFFGPAVVGPVYLALSSNKDVAAA